MQQYNQRVREGHVPDPEPEISKWHADFIARLGDDSNPDPDWWKRETKTVKDALGAYEERQIQRLLAHHAAGGAVTEYNTIPGDSHNPDRCSASGGDVDRIASAIERQGERE